MRGEGEGSQVALPRFAERRKDLLFYLLPLSSPVLHSKKKDSEGGVIGRLLLFHENGGKRGAVSRKRERRKDRGFRVLEPQRAKRRPSDHCTQRSSLGGDPLIRLARPAAAIRLSFPPFLSAKSNFSNCVFPINLRPFNPSCFFNPSYERVSIIVPNFPFNIFNLSFDPRESTNSATIRRIDFLKIIRDSRHSCTISRFFFEFFHSSTNSLLFQTLVIVKPIHRTIESPRCTPPARYKCSLCPLIFDRGHPTPSAVARRCIWIRVYVRFVNHGDTSGTISTREVTSSPALGHYFATHLRRCAGDKMFISVIESLVCIVFNDP